MSVKVAVIPVAGHGTRLLPLTKSTPKELLPLGRKPVLQHVAEEMQAAGVRDLVMITSKEKNAIEQHFKKNTALQETLSLKGNTDALQSMLFMENNSRCHYVQQEQQKGLGHAVLCARDTVGDQAFIVALGDAKMADDINPDNTPAGAPPENNASLCRRMISVFDRHSADAVISFQQVAVEAVSRYGVADLKPGYRQGDDMFVLSGIIEKPAAADAPSRYVVAARYLFKPLIFDYLQRTLPGHGGEIQLTDAVQAMIEDGAKVLGVPLQGCEKRYDVGNFESYYSAFIETALADPQCGSALRAHIKKLLQQ